MANYYTPDNFYFRLHHVRPRFKDEVENVLGYVSFGIADIGEKPTEQFNRELEKYLRGYGRNAASSDKTIKNWRTEIAALFGLYSEHDGISTPTFSCIDLANNSNLEHFFRNFIFSFQYPGGFLKSDAIAKIIEEGVSFHPGRWLANYFLSSNDTYITKAEFCHCVYHDLRVTRDHEKLQTTIARIKENRLQNKEYDSQGDVIRYAGDILDYMVLGGLLSCSTDIEKKYYRNDLGAQTLLSLKNSTYYFDKYDKISPDNPAINALEYDWVKYTESVSLENSRKFDAFADRVSDKVIEKVIPPENNVFAASDTDTAEIGDAGEQMIHTHEVLRVKNAGRIDLVHLIKRIPTRFAIGYDIKSVEVLTEDLRAIEVKTSVSKAPLSFNRFHLTTNEWKVAEDLGDKYFLYRLQISDDGCKLFVIQNPVLKYKQDVIRMIPRDGADIVFDEKAGQYVDLLCVH